MLLLLLLFVFIELFRKCKMPSAVVLSVVLCLMCGVVAVTVVDAVPAGDARFDFTDGTYDMSDLYPHQLPRWYPTFPLQVPEIPRNNWYA